MNTAATTKKVSYDLAKIKKELKAMAEKIVWLKTGPIRDLHQRLNDTKDYDARRKIIKQLNSEITEREVLRIRYRILHVAYCELRGKRREIIERKMTKAGELDNIVIHNIKLQYIEEG